MTKRIQTWDFRTGRWHNAWRNVPPLRAIEMQQELEYERGIPARIIE